MDDAGKKVAENGDGGKALIPVPRLSCLGRLIQLQRWQARVFCVCACALFFLVVPVRGWGFACFCSDLICANQFQYKKQR